MSNDVNTAENLLFSATFCAGAIKAQGLEYSERDANIMSWKLRKVFQAADKDSNMVKLPKALEFNVASQTFLKFHCTAKREACILLRVKYGSNLMIRGVDRLI